MSAEETLQQAIRNHQAGRLDEAAALYDQVLVQFPGHPDTLHLRGVADMQRGRFDSAILFFERGLAVNQRHAATYANYAAALLALDRFEEALASSERALAIEPSLASAQTNKGHALAGLGRHGAALESFTQALLAQPHASDALRARAALFFDSGRYDDAVSDCDRTFALGSRTADVLTIRGRALRALGKLEEALADLEAALHLDPTAKLLPGEVAYVSLQLCAWKGIDAKIAAVLAGLDRGRLTVEPLMAVNLPSTAVQQLTAASMFFNEGAAEALPYPRLVRRAGKRLRIGYFSTDLHDHPVAHLMLGVLEAHDRSQFEVNAYAFGGDPNSVLRHRIAATVDEFIDIAGTTDDEVVAQCRAHHLHIAVDLNGYTGAMRTGLFARGVAPLQVNFLGYPGTLGTNRYDYIIGDAVVTPPAHHAHFAERIVTMPHTYLVNSDLKRHFIARPFTRAELGLPEKGFIFASFNAVTKITPDLFDVWMRLLAKVEGSVLWLSESGSGAAARNLRREARARGVNPDRLVFTPRTAGPEYLSRFRTADLFLDTFYYNGHATASDALLVGLPLLTRLGNTFASRVAASLLTVAGLPELIAPDSMTYEKTALRLAAHPEELAALRRRLEHAISGSPLFDARRFARDLEKAFSEIWRRYEAGLPSDHIAVG